MKHRTVIVKIQHQAGIRAANTVNMKQRELVDFNAFEGSTFAHRNIPQNSLDQNASGQQPAQISASSYLQKVRPVNFLKLSGKT